MRLLVTGGTGSIGSAVIAATHGRGWDTLALARSVKAAGQLQSAGSMPVAGNLFNAGEWLSDADAVDAVIHLAATFGGDMAEADAAFTDALLDWLPRRADQAGAAVPVVYTGGLWLYGPVGDQTAVEGSPFDPPLEFAYMVEHRRRLFESTDASVRIVHPAMVWHESGGVIAGFLADARNGRSPRVTGSLHGRWPLVHREDLADLYPRVVEKGESRGDYHGVAESGVPVGRIASAIAARYGAPEPVVRSISDAVAQHGTWAACQAYDQTMAAPRTRTALAWRPRRPQILETFPGEPGR